MVISGEAQENTLEFDFGCKETNAASTVEENVGGATVRFVRKLE